MLSSVLFLLQIRCAEPEGNLRPHERMEGWCELRVYLGLWFMLGLQSKRHMRVFGLETPNVPDFPQTMSLHLADNKADHPANDQLWKPRPVLDVVDETFSTVFVPNKTISVDESLWSLKGAPSGTPVHSKQESKQGLEGV